MVGYGYVYHAVCCMMLSPSSWCQVGVPLYTKLYGICSMMLWCMFYDGITIQLVSVGVPLYTKLYGVCSMMLLNYQALVI